MEVKQQNCVMYAHFCEINWKPSMRYVQFCLVLENYLFPNLGLYERNNFLVNKQYMSLGN